MSDYLSALGVTQWIPKDYLEGPLADFVNRKVYVRGGAELVTGARLVVLLADPAEQFSQPLFDDIALSLDAFPNPLGLVVASAQPTPEWSQTLKLRKTDKVLVWSLPDSSAPFQDAIELSGSPSALASADFKRQLYNGIVQSVLELS